MSGKANGLEKLHGLCTSVYHSFWITAYVILRHCFNCRYDRSTGQKDDHDWCLCLSILVSLSKVEVTKLNSRVHAAQKERSHSSEAEFTKPKSRGQKLKSRGDTAQTQRSYSPKLEITQLKSRGHTSQKQISQNPKVEVRSSKAEFTKPNSRGQKLKSRGDTAQK